jgi:hypothetical protein
MELTVLILFKTMEWEQYKQILSNLYANDDLGMPKDNKDML